MVGTQELQEISFTPTVKNDAFMVFVSQADGKCDYRKTTLTDVNRKGKFLGGKSLRVPAEGLKKG